MLPFRHTRTCTYMCGPWRWQSTLADIVLSSTNITLIRRAHANHCLRCTDRTLIAFSLRSLHTWSVTVQLHTPHIRTHTHTCTNVSPTHQACGPAFEPTRDVRTSAVTGCVHRLRCGMRVRACECAFTDHACSTRTDTAHLARKHRITVFVTVHAYLDCTKLKTSLVCAQHHDVAANVKPLNSYIEHCCRYLHVCLHTPPQIYGAMCTLCAAGVHAYI
jgi:hypothetical protein